MAFVDPGYTGDEPTAAAEQHDIQLEVVKLPNRQTRLHLIARTLLGG